MQEYDQTPQTVLIVDDDEALLASVVSAVQTLTTMRVLSAQSGAAGLALAVSEHPDCIIVDVMLSPGQKKEMDGFQFVQIIRGDPQTASIPVVFLTARGQDIDRFAGLAVGGDNYLVKPVSMRLLIGAIEMAIATSALERRQRLQRLAESEPPRPVHD
jgi:DNA-binding response OmpR family regulator